MNISEKDKINDVSDRILSYIIDNGLKIGDRLPSEEQMVSLFGVSRVSVREGLRGLKFNGLVESSKKGGTRICDVNFFRLTQMLGFQIASSKLSFRQLAEARFAIEMGAVEFLMDRITPGQLAELREIAGVPTEGDRSRANECDGRFHQTLLKFTGNQILIAFSQLLAIFFNAYRDVHESDRSGTPTDNHLLIIEALETKNLDLARGVMRVHLKHYATGIHREHWKL